MKNTKILLFAAILMAGALTASAQIIYQQNFDAVGQSHTGSVGISSVLPGWAVNMSALGGNVSNTTVSTGAHTLTAGSYLGPGDGSDFDFEIYDTLTGAPTHTNSINFTYTNTSSSAQAGVIGSFDFEAAWSRYANAQEPGQTAGFDNGLTYSVNGGPANSLPGTVTSVTNAGVNGTTIPTGTWLTDAQMNTASLAIRNITFSLGSVVLNPGDTVQFSWSNVGPTTGQTFAFGLDNFELGDNNNLMVPEPSTWVGATLATLMLGVQVVRARSFSKRREHG